MRKVVEEKPFKTFEFFLTLGNHNFVYFGLVGSANFAQQKKQFVQ